MGHYELNPDKKVVESIKKRLEVTGGHCPCVAQNVWSEDTICPCKFFRVGNGCHCKLYVEKD